MPQYEVWRTVEQVIFVSADNQNQAKMYVINASHEDYATYDDGTKYDIKELGVENE